MGGDLIFNNSAMKRLILLFLIVGKLYSIEFGFHPFSSGIHFTGNQAMENYVPYISPGIKLAYDFKSGLRIEKELTIGIVTASGINHNLISYSISIGSIHFKKSNNKLKYLTLSTSKNFFGVSMGKLINEKQFVGNRISLFGSFVAPFVTFDYLKVKSKIVSGNHFSVSGMIKHPITITTSGNMHIVTP